MSAPYTIAFYVNSVPVTRAVRDGEASLGGSESACFGLARALSAQGHDVHILAQRLAEDARGVDAAGVTWHDAGPHDAEVYHWCGVVEPDLFVSLRMAHIFAAPIQARYRVLWNQDLLTGGGVRDAIMATSWQVDRYVYVSDYHRRQWEDVCPDLRGLGWVTRNGFDPAHVPTDVAKVPGRICYISRPERGLAPLLEMWPALKAAVPHAELHLTRYASMYDGEGGQVRAMCDAYDRMTAEVSARVPGIVVHQGGLGKADLYRLIASSEVMWYPGVAGFAETSCVAAIEAQACGTDFVGSRKGALPETAPYAWLLDGDAMTPEYQRQSVQTVVRALTAPDTRERRVRMDKVWAHVQARYAYAAIAVDWSEWLTEAFADRYATQTRGVLAQLLQYDDHVVALPVARGLDDADAVARCERVIAGQDMTADDYAERALPDAVHEAATDGRLRACVPSFAGCRHVLDLACGNGAFAIALAQADPAVRVTGLDYAADNIARGREAAARAGVADRVRFEAVALYDFDAQRIDPTGLARMADAEPPVDGVFVGEFLEHIADVTGFLSGVASAVAHGTRVVCTMPSGPFTELAIPGQSIKRGHVHHYAYDDLVGIFGRQQDIGIAVMSATLETPRGNPCTHWHVSFRTSAEPFGTRDVTRRAVTTRPMPRLTVGILVGPGAAVDLPRCLLTVRDVADEIVLGVCGRGHDIDEIARLAARDGARVIEMPAVADLEHGFAQARNTLLEAATGEWFLWIDTDEQLVGGQALRKYLDAHTFAGYVIRQNHLQLDADRFHDEPVRLFRTDRGIRFFGCVHEQPQMGDPNRDIWPVLGPTDVQIAHYGYLTEGVRRKKSQTRNLSLLVRDRQHFAERLLGRVLWMREFATWLVEIGHKRPTYEHAMRSLVGTFGPEALSHLVFEGEPIPMSGQALAAFAADYYERHFPDHAHPLAKLARPFYETALQVLPGSWEMAYSFAARQGGLQGRGARQSRAWVRSLDDARGVLAQAHASLADAFRAETVKTDPALEEAV